MIASNVPKRKQRWLVHMQKKKDQKSVLLKKKHEWNYHCVKKPQLKLVQVVDVFFYTLRYWNKCIYIYIYPSASQCKKQKEITFIYMYRFYDFSYWFFHWFFYIGSILTRTSIIHGRETPKAWAKMSRPFISFLNLFYLF